MSKTLSSNIVIVPNSCCLDLDHSYFPDLLKLLFNTYAFYQDRRSRKAVQQCIRTIFSAGAPPDKLAGFVKDVQAEAAKPGIAPSNAFVLVEWCSVLLQEFVGTENWPKWGLNIISSDAQALEICQSASPRSNLTRSAIVATRRALRKIVSRPDTCQQSIHDIISNLTAKSIQPIARNSIMLGVCAGVCARNPDAKSIFEHKKSDIYAFYTREILGSRTQLPAHIVNGLQDFFLTFTSSEDVEKEITPSLEKGLLRAPEIILNDLVTPLFKSLSPNIDLSNILKNRLLKPLLSNVKSTNVLIRQGGLRAFQAAFSKCHDETAIIYIADEVLNLLKSGKLTVADHRVIHCEILAALTINKVIAQKVLPTLAAVAGKETNEAALGAEISVLSQYTIWLLRDSQDVPKIVLDTFAKGISDKKVAARRLWTLRLGDVMWSLNDSESGRTSLTIIATTTLAPCLNLWNEVVANALAAAQSGLVTVNYVLTAVIPTKIELVHDTSIISSLKKAKAVQQALEVEPKPSFLLNHRIYSKLTGAEDFIWFIRALGAVSYAVALDETDSVLATAWSQAMIYCICAHNTTSTVRRQATTALSEAYIKSPSRIGQIMINGIWRWLSCVELAENDCAAAASKSENSNLYLVVRAICLSPAELAAQGGELNIQIREQQMISLLVLSRPELLPHVSWIELCLRMCVDPGDLARKHTDALITEVLSITDFDEKVGFLC